MRVPFFLFLLFLSFVLVGQTKWHFTYWMPYDNNLNAWVDSINSMISTPEFSRNITVSLQVDRLGRGGMQRYQIDSNGVQLVGTVESDNSHSGLELEKYLKWVSEHFDAENHAVIFLDHGGKLDEVGLDEFPTRRFLRIDSIRMALEKFNTWNEKQLELLYFQVCAKGSIEPMYEVSEVSSYILTSQNKLGAPNFYYQSLFSSMASSLPKDGRELAKLIFEFEQNDMYSSITLLETRYFLDVKKAFENFIKLVDSSADGLSWKSSYPLFILYDGVYYWDIIYFLKGFRTEGKELAELETLINAIHHLINAHYINPVNLTMRDYCGLSLMALGSNYSSALSTYSHLRFFHDFPMESLFQRFFEMNK